VISGLPGDIQDVIVKIATVAQALPLRIFLVGGVVRDQLLGVGDWRDVDFAVEGDVAALSAAIVAQLPLRIVAQHAPFGTATLATNDSHSALLIDLARTRVETYPQPAVLPIVSPAPLAEDLIRRDFSINAMAVELLLDSNVLRFGPLIDPFGGAQDLAERQLRILHPQSFRDDPTRILRGLRLAARLDLQLDPATQAALNSALAAEYLALPSVERIQNELCLALGEPSPAAVLQRAEAWNVTSAIAPGLRWRPELADAERQLQQAEANVPRELLAAGLLTYSLDDAKRHHLLRRFRFPTEFSRLIVEIGSLRAMLPAIALIEQDSVLEQRLRPFSSAALLVVHYADRTPASDRIDHYLQNIRPLAPLLDGRELQRLGVQPGPQLGALLAALRVAQLDQGLNTREAAENWIRDQITR
jgi:tRNA nucleotidyltransferase (CCA-adding enzyme)